jgi:hypothetical protein
MTQPRDPETIISMWLEDGPIDLPAETRRAIEVGLRTQSRVRRMAFPGGITMLPLTRLATAAAILVAVGAVSLVLFSNRNNVVGGPAAAPSVSAPPATAQASAAPSSTAGPSPSASPSMTLLDTTGWASYVSDRYGFSIARPSGWTVEPATRNWTFANDLAAWENLEATEHFNNAAGSVGVSAWSSQVARGTTVEAFIDAYCQGLKAPSCSGLTNRAVNVETKDGHAGLGLFVSDFDTMTFFLDGRTIYVVGVWRDETDPTVQPYGGARRLLQSIVSTMTLKAPAQESPAAS